MNARDELRWIIKDGSGKYPDPELTDAIVEFVAAWLEDNEDELSDRLLLTWREDMGR